MNLKLRMKKRKELKIQLARNFRLAARAMPDARDGHDMLFRENLVNDTVRAKNNFPNRFVIFLRHDPAKLRKLRQNVHLGYEQTAERFSDGRIILGNEQHDGLQIVARALRPDYLESHVASCRLTSSWGMVWPRSIWSRPLRMAAINSTRSAMASRLAFSGKRSIESKTSCLSLMTRNITPAVSRRKREAGAGEKTSETVIQKIFDELPVP